MPFTAKQSLLTDYLLNDLLESRKVELGLRALYYCDQENIPEVPAVCVEPGLLQRELRGVPLRTTNEFMVSILVYCANVEGVSDAQQDADQYAEAVIDCINQDGVPANHGGTQFGGLVIYGYVQTSEYGYRVKSNKLMRANRMLVYAKSETNLLEA